MCVLSCHIFSAVSTHHPDHDVGEASDPDGGSEEGDHEPSLPAPLGAVRHSEEQKQRERPHDEPLHFSTHTSWRKTRKKLGLDEMFSCESFSRVLYLEL